MPAKKTNIQYQYLQEELRNLFEFFGKLYHFSIDNVVIVNLLDQIWFGQFGKKMFKLCNTVAVSLLLARYLIIDILC